MNRSLNIKNLVLVMGLIILAQVMAPQAQALNIVTKENFNIDKALIKQAANSNLADAVVVAPLELPEGINITDSEWYEGMFYYMSSRLGQGDFLAHYFVTKDGSVWQGNTLGDEQRFKNATDTEKPIVVIYLAGSGSSDFTLQAKESLKTLLLSLCNTNAINPSKILSRSYVLNLKTNEGVSIKTDILGGSYDVSLKQIATAIAPQYVPSIRNYALAISSIELPTAAVNYGDSVVMNVSIKNNSNNILYEGSDYEPVITKTTNESSKFYLNGTWASQTQTEIMSENSLINPGETKTFAVKLNVPLYFGKQTEKFQLVSATGKVYAGTTFEMSLTINRTAKEVVEITATETGQLNVRDGAYASSSVFTRVTPGQRFFVLERTNSGYVKLDLGNGKSGWVVSKYTKVV